MVKMLPHDSELSSVLREKNAGISATLLLIV